MTDIRMTPRLEALELAASAVVARAGAYGAPTPFFAKVAKRWSLTLGVEISPRQVVLCLLDMKQERACQGDQPDTPVDIAGYAACLYEVDRVQAGACTIPGAETRR